MCHTHTNTLINTSIFINHIKTAIKHLERHFAKSEIWWIILKSTLRTCTFDRTHSGIVIAFYLLSREVLSFIEANMIRRLNCRFYFDVYKKAYWQNHLKMRIKKVIFDSISIGLRISFQFILHLCKLQVINNARLKIADQIQYSKCLMELKISECDSEVDVRMKWRVCNQLNNKITIYCLMNFTLMLCLRLARLDLKTESTNHVFHTQMPQMNIIWRNWDSFPCMGNNWTRDEHKNGENICTYLVDVYTE